MTTHDALILGTSPNALCAAALLARAGWTVLVLDTHDTVGGPVATEPFAPGFLADTGVPSAALASEIVEDLDLRIGELRRETVTALAPEPLTLREARKPAPGDTLQSSRTPILHGPSFTHPALPAAFHHAVDLLRSVHRTLPPDIALFLDEGIAGQASAHYARYTPPHGDPARQTPPAASDRAALAALAAELFAHGPRGVHEALRLLFLSIRDFLREADVPPLVQGLLATVAMRGVSAGPFDQGTLLGLVERTAMDDGLYTSTVYGGLGKLPAALADKARSFGAEIRTSVPGPLRIDVEDGAARGVSLPTGERLSAKLVLSDHDARVTFTRLVSPALLDPEQNRAIRHLRYRGTTARVHLGLDRLPTFRGVAPAALRGTLILAPDVASLERAWDHAKRGQLPPHPPIEITVPSALDATLAPDGKHVLSASVHFVPTSFDDRPALLRALLDSLSPFAPDLPSSVLCSQVSLPRDIESRFGLTEGHLLGGEATHAQSFFLRPFPGFSRHRTPVDNLYLCGSAAHPPGYSGLSGWNLARSLLT